MLVVGGVDEGDAVGLDAIGGGQRRMVEVLRGDADVVDLEAAGRELGRSD